MPSRETLWSVIRGGTFLILVSVLLPMVLFQQVTHAVLPLT